MKRKLLSILLTLCLAFSLLPTAALADEGEEDGTHVGTQTDLRTALENPSVTEIVLDDDIVFTDVWTPVELDKDRTLIINGQGHTISDLTVTGGILAPSGSGVAGDGHSCDYYAGFIGTNKGTLTINNLKFDNADVDIKPVTESLSSTGSSMVSVVCAHNQGDIVYNNVDVRNSVVRGYTKVGLLLGFTSTPTAGSFVANHCALVDCEVGVEADGTDPEACLNAVIIGYDSYNHAKTNGIKIENVTCTIDESVQWPAEIQTREDGTKYVYAYGASYGIFSPTYTHDSYGVATVAMVAEVNGYQYETLAAAISAAKDGDTVTLLKDTEVSNPTLIKNTITLDLNGKTVKACKQAFQIAAYGNLPGGSLTVTGSGTIDGQSQDFTFFLFGSEVKNSDKSVKLTIDKDVKIIKGKNAISVYPYNYGPVADGVYVDIYGDIEANQPIYVSGNIHAEDGNVPEINLHNGADFTILNNELYLAGYAKTTIEDGVTITNPAGNAVTIAAGELVINGGTFVGGNTIGGVAGTGGAIDVDTSSAVYVKQHGTNLNLKVTINNGTFTAAVPFYQATGASDTPVPDKVELTINGGKFASNRAVTDGGIAVKSDDKTGFITGGLFSTDPSAYCAAGKTGVASGNSQYPYTVGAKVDGAEPAHVDTATVPAKTTSNDETVKSVASAIAGANVTNSAAEAATKDLANKNELKGDSVLEDNTTVVSKLNAATSGATEAGNVAIVYQTYVDVTVTDAKKDENGVTEITVDLTPMYRVVATTSDVVNSDQDIEVDGNNGVNAVVIEEGKKLDLPEQEYEVKLALPTGFANAGAKLSIKHTKGNGTVEYYTGTVSVENGNLYVTFTTKGFSPFTISAPAASIGETMYPTLAEAIAKAANGSTIKLEKNCDESVTVSGKSLTIDKNNHEYNFAKVTVDSNSTKTENGGTLTITYTAPSSSSGSSGYYVSTPGKTENGTVTVSPRYADKGDTVTITVKPDSGYVLGSLTVTDSKGNELKLTDKGNGKYTFTMPSGRVEVKASFTKEVETSPFADVATDAYYYEAVKWAVKNGITTGVGDNLFAPGQPCTRAQIVTFLWRAAGSPEPKGTAAGMTDVVTGSYYEKAVAWAIENGVTTGTTATTFSPDATCTRAQAVTFLARALNAKAASAAEFSDVPTDSYFAEAVAWAAANGVTEGVGNGLFAPDNDCTRGQIVTFLYRAYNK